MALLLVARQELDNQHEVVPNYQRGDVIAVVPDDWKFGKKEGPPKFVVIHVPGEVNELERDYMEADYDWEEEVRGEGTPDQKSRFVPAVKHNRRVRSLRPNVMEQADRAAERGQIMGIQKAQLIASTDNRREIAGRIRRYPKDGTTNRRSPRSP